MQKSAIGCAFSVAIILVIIGAALAGYALGSANVGTKVATKSTLATSQSTQSFSSQGNDQQSTSVDTAVTVTSYQSFSSTIPPPTTYTAVATTLDSRLAVDPMLGPLSRTNATSIAESLASGLDELPIGLVSHHLPTCSSLLYCDQEIFVFNTSNGSNVTVAIVNGSLYSVNYVAQDSDALNNDFFNNLTINNSKQIPYNQTFADESAAVATATVNSLMLNEFGIAMDNMTFDNVTGANWIDLMQEYNGTQIANGGVIGITFYPPTSQVLWLSVIENSGWYSIPQNLPLQISPSTALQIAEGYATNTLHFAFINYASVSLQIVQNHMYYAATLESNQFSTYLIFVNPITGEIGYPESS